MNFKDEEVLAGWENILTNKYMPDITDVADSYPDKRSIFILYGDIDDYDPDLAMFMMDRPDKCLALGRKVVKNLMPPTWDRKGEINLRITKIPKDSHIEIRNLRQEHLRKFVSVDGLVRKVTSVKPRMTKALFKCAKCDAEMWVDQHRMKIRKPAMCNSPEGSCNKATAQFTLQDELSIYVDTQRIEIQESPEGLRGGAQPERLTGYLEDDLSGVVFPGNRVTLNGIIRPVQKGERDDSLVFETFLEIHSVDWGEDVEYDEINITEEDEKEIEEMSEDPKLFDKLIHSVSPTIFGLETEKEAIVLQLFGGTHKEMDDGTTIRGDIHILLVGDPGVAKSQLLRYMSNLAPRGIYASGKSASAAGLCVDGETIIQTENGPVTIKDFVETRMNDPEEYKPGIWRQAVTGERVIAVTENGIAKGLPVSYIWKIKTPPFLVEILTSGNDRLTLTPETKIFAGKDMRFDWIAAKDITPGTLAMVASKDKMILKATEVKEVSEIPGDGYVYDLTVEQAHSFIGNGFAVHNTAAAVKDDFGDGRWTLEAGALVLADKGLACIDELDKMSEQDTSSLHEAMESQKISVAKAGITATLQCRCSMLAAANPKKGRFDPNQQAMEQINLLPTLISRFDLILVIKDKPEPVADKRITEHILNVHLRGQAKTRQKKEGDVKKIMDDTDSMRPDYGSEILRKYVAYSKRIIPMMTDEALKAIGENYLKIRSTGDGPSVPITARQLEAYIRLSEASARARLSDRVTLEDAERSIRLMRYYLSTVAGREGTTKWDIDTIATGMPATVRDDMGSVLEAIRTHESNNEGRGATKTDIMGIMESRMSETQLSITLEKLEKAGEIYSPSIGVYRVL